MMAMAEAGRSDDSRGVPHGSLDLLADMAMRAAKPGKIRARLAESLAAGPRGGSWAGLPITGGPM